MKDVCSKPFLTDGSLVSFDIGVLLGFSQLDVAWRYVVFTGPLDERATHIFWPIIHAYHRRISTPCYGLVEATYYPRRWQ